MAAAACLNTERSPSHALEVLEAGRGVVASLLLDMRSDLSDLRQKHPDLAERFEVLGERLNSESNVGEYWGAPIEAKGSHPDSSQANRQIRLHKEFDELVQIIRNQVGFSEFLLPLSADEMMAAAYAGPIVIINISHIRCDAIIVEPQRIRTIPLEQLKYREVEERSSSLLASSSYRVYSSEFLVPLLEWMWRAAARPVLDELGIMGTPEGDDWPHVWWIPTGGMTHLPIHAAGLQGRGTYETVVDRVISSYTTSVKSLVHNRRQIMQNASSVKESQHALLIAMTETPHQTSLPFATEEVTAIKPFLQGTGLVAAEGIEQTDDVLRNLSSCQIIHFAGHGMSHPSDPASSCLLTKDWEKNPLTVEKLRKERL